MECCGEKRELLHDFFSFYCFLPDVHIFMLNEVGLPVGKYYICL